jgi:hypothetical protein
MSKPHDVPDDQEESLLRPVAAPDDFTPLRDRTLALTVGVIRFRRRLKRCALAASLVGCFLAGVATTELLGHGRGERSPLPAERVVAGRSPSAPDASPPLPGSRASAERQAHPAALTREASLRRQADRRLLDQSDVKSAIRSYRRALQLASADQQAILPNRDSWLLMALKNDQSKEMKNVPLQRN